MRTFCGRRVGSYMATFFDFLEAHGRLVGGRRVINTLIRGPLGAF